MRTWRVRRIDSFIHQRRFTYSVLDRYWQTRQLNHRNQGFISDYKGRKKCSSIVSTNPWKRRVPERSNGPIQPAPSSTFSSTGASLRHLRDTVTTVMPPGGRGDASRSKRGPPASTVVIDHWPGTMQIARKTRNARSFPSTPSVELPSSSLAFPPIMQLCRSD